MLPRKWIYGTKQIKILEDGENADAGRSAAEQLRLDKYAESRIVKTRYDTYRAACKATGFEPNDPELDRDYAQAMQALARATERARVAAEETAITRQIASRMETALYGTNSGEYGVDHTSEAPAASPLKRGETRKGRVDAIRDDIAAKKLKRRAVASAPRLVDDLINSARQYYEQGRFALDENTRNALSPRGYFDFRLFPSMAGVDAAAQLTYGPAYAGFWALHEWATIEATLRASAARVTAGQPAGMSDADRESRLAQIDREIFALEVAEEAEITASEAEGQPVMRRADCDIWAILGLHERSLAERVFQKAAEILPDRLRPGRMGQAEERHKPFMEPSADVTALRQEQQS